MDDVPFTCRDLQGEKDVRLVESNRVLHFTFSRLPNKGRIQQGKEAVLHNIAWLATPSIQSPKCYSY